MLSKKWFIGLIAALAASCANAAPAADELSRKEAQQKMAAAQDRLEQAAREVAEMSAQLATDGNPDRMVFLGRNSNRAMLGIGIGRDDKQSEDGVRVLSVSPGGPAAGAGIKAGDIIVELNGTSLKRDKENDANEKLVSIMAKLSDGDDVKLSYRRDGKVSAVKLKAEKLPRTARMPLQFERRIVRGDRADFDNYRDFEIFDGFRSVHMGAFGAIELVPLSPKLGQYFGTEKGLLVVRVPQDKDLKLEDGDVLIDIDGRVPTNPSHAFRILSSYQPGEKVTLNVLRQHKKAAVAVTIPEHEQFGPRAPAPPRPPRPGAAIAPVAPATPAPASTT